MDGGSRVAEVLQANGVEFLFTLVGGHISPILVSSKRRGIRVIDTRHEVNAVFAADAVARLTGVPGVAAVTAGPGVTNSLTAIKNAQLAQSPLVLLGGATATMLRGRGSLQDIDQVSLMEPHVKWLARPNTLREVTPAIEEAFVQCQSGVPGPVFVELAVDLLYPESVVRDWYRKQIDKPNKTLLEHAMSTYIRGHLAYQFAFAGPGMRGDRQAPPPPEAPRELIQRAAQVLERAERPVMVLGSQTMLRPHKIDRLLGAIEKLNIPVYLSGMARGLLGRDHPLQKRHKRRNALKEADAVLLSGVPNDFRLDYGSHVARAKVVSVNLSEEDLHKNRKPTVGVLADPCTFLCQLADAMAPGPPRSAWMATLDGRDAEREKEIAGMADGSTELLNPLEICQGIERHLGDDSVLVGDGGDFVATASYIVRPPRPYSWLDPGVFGTLGVGAGFALGAKLVHPQADVWLLYGDGAAGFSIMEYDTFVRHQVPVISVVGNDAGWTQIERDQVVVLEDDVACRLAYTDYHVIAEGCGAHGIMVKDRAALDGALDQALEVSRQGKPVLVNALMGKSDFRKGSISI